MSAPTPDLVWRAQISGLLADLTKEVLALTEVVIRSSRSWPKPRLPERRGDERPATGGNRTAHSGRAEGMERVTPPRSDVEAMCCRCGSYETKPEKRWCNACWDDQIGVPSALLARLEQLEREREHSDKLPLVTCSGRKTLVTSTGTRRSKHLTDK